MNTAKLRPFGQEEGKGGGADGANSTPEHEREEDKEMADEEALYDPTKTEEEDMSEGQDDDAGSVVGYDPLTGAPKKK